MSTQTPASFGGAGVVYLLYLTRVWGTDVEGR